MTVIGEMWEEKYNALLDNYNQMCANRDVAVTNSSNLLKRLDVANEMLLEFISYVEDSVLMDYENRSYGLDTLVDKAREATK